MRRLVGLIVAASLAVASLIFLATSSSNADPECQVTDPETGECLIEIVIEPTATATPGVDFVETGSGHPCYWDGSSQGISDPPPGPVPCTSEYGYWSNHYHCYLSLVDPQPPAGDPSWQGHEPGDGAVYRCYQPVTDIVIYVWAQNPPSASGSGPTPAQVAEIAIDRMELKAIDIGIAPKPGPDSVGLVGMPVWMWAENPGSTTYGPTTASASAGGMTVTATARVLRITWDMGDGSSVVCESAGTPYDASQGDADSPDCGHTYTRTSSREPGGKYTVTATSEWIVTWEGAGQSGTILLDGLQRSVEIAVGEGQVLVR